MSDIPTSLIFGITLIVLVAALVFWLTPIIRRERKIGSKIYHTGPMSRVILENDTVTCIRPGGTVESFSFQKLISIEILTTEDGPFLPDLFWVFHEEAGGGAVIPAEAEGFQEVADRAFDLEGFDFSRFIESQGSTSPATFPVWKRPSGS